MEMGIHCSLVKVSSCPSSNQGYGQGLAGLYASMVLAQGWDSASPISVSPTSSQVVSWTDLPLHAVEAPEVIRARKRAARGRDNAAAAVRQAAELRQAAEQRAAVNSRMACFAERPSGVLRRAAERRAAVKLETCLSAPCSQSLASVFHSTGPVECRH